MPVKQSSGTSVEQRSSGTKPYRGAVPRPIGIEHLFEYLFCMSLSRVHLVLLEDDDVDAEFVIRALRRSGIGAPVTHFYDGLEAVEAMRDPQRNHLPMWPLMILLDLNMPGLDGFEFLDILRSDPELGRAVVFVLTQSTRSEDIEAAYDRQVAGYLVKSNLGEDYSLLPQLLMTYCRLVALVPRGR
jgi:CheY-like chemotaxis protein